MSLPLESPLMLFPTPSFAIFFVAVFIGGWMLFTGRSAWRYFMLAASYLFCGLFDWRFVWLFAAITLLGWLGLVAIEKLGAGSASGLGSGPARAVLAASVALHVGVLVWFKQLGFFVTSATALLGRLGLETGWTAVQVAIPVGISFLVFRGISATVDVYRGKAPAPSLLDYALFMTFFPYLAAGPIGRLAEVVPQLIARRAPSPALAAQGFLLIAGGLVKKMLIADYLARVAVDEVFAAPRLFSSADSLGAIYAYAAQIYCDFSGYTDMAIGIALLLGITLPQNFDMPYAALTLQSFWRKWHMTLSRFLRDYVYIPLGGNRKGEGRTYLNLVLTFFIGGLWHGAGATFAIWGLIHGVGLAVERWLAGRAQRRAEWRAAAAAARGDEFALAHAGKSPADPRQVLPAPVAWFVTFHFVCLAWVFFRADSAGTALRVIGRVFTGWDVPSQLPAAAWIVIVLVIAIQFVPGRAREFVREHFGTWRPVWQAVALAVVLFVVSVIGPQGPTAFIYAGF